MGAIAHLPFPSVPMALMTIPAHHMLPKGFNEMPHVGPRARRAPAKAQGLVPGCNLHLHARSPDLPPTALHHIYSRCAARSQQGLYTAELASDSPRLRTSRGRCERLRPRGKLLGERGLSSPGSSKHGPYGADCPGSPLKRRSCRFLFFPHLKRASSDGPRDWSGCPSSFHGTRTTSPPCSSTSNGAG